MPAADVSLCMIVKDDVERLAHAVASARPHVAEVCIVSNATSESSVEAARALADRFAVRLDVNFEDGNIADFGKARNASFALATCDAALWIDSDDILVGGERLAEVLATMAKPVPMFYELPYEYEHDDKGRVKCLQPRERLFRPVSAFRWENRVHEVCKSREARVLKGETDAVRVVHTRTDKESAASTRRNIRILKGETEERPDDPRVRFYLAMAYFDAQLFDEARAHFEAYLAMGDGNEEQHAVAAMRMTALYQERGDLEGAFVWAMRALSEREWAECYFGLARVHNTMAEQGGPTERRHWERAAHFARVGLSLPETRSSMWVNPLDRAFYAHGTLNVALAKIGDVKGALASATTALHAIPDDKAMRANALLYEAELARRATEESAAALERVRAKAVEMSSAGVIGRAVLRAVQQGTGAAASRPEGSLDVVFACGDGPEVWSPKTAERNGVGGSETAVIEMSKRLAAKGHRVRVFTNCGHDSYEDGVEWLTTERIERAEPCDILVAWRIAPALEVLRSRVRWLWVHDVMPGAADAWNIHIAERVLALSEWHAGHMADNGIPREKIWRTRNGIDPERFEAPVIRDPKKVVYATSPARGLDQVLDMWPAIRERVPVATLDVLYGFGVWAALAAGSGSAQETKRIDALVARLAEMESLGVTTVGRVNGGEVARRMLGAGVLAYPSWNGETAHEDTSCITAMEARAAGLYIVTSPRGALPETCAGRAHMIDGDARTPEYQAAFVDAVVEALGGDDSGAMRAVVQTEARETLGWDAVADEWETAMREDMESATPRATSSDKPRLHMVLSPDASGRQIIDPGDPTGGSMGGGSKSGFMGLVRAMGRRGDFRVTAFSTFRERQVSIGGVDYIRLDTPEDHGAPEVAFAYYDVRPLVGVAPPTLRIGSHHTLDPYRAFPWIDVNTAPSEWAAEHLRRCFRPRGTWRVLPNAIEGLDKVKRKPVRGRVVYHTSPDRGLQYLFEAWPEVRRRAPHATLHVVSKVADLMANWGRLEMTGSEEYEIATRVAKGVETAREAGGFKLYGPMVREALLEELAAAEVFAYPAQPVAPCETFSASVLECCSLGLPVVVVGADALASVWQGAADVVEPGDGAMREFVERLVLMLTDKQRRDSFSHAGRARASLYSFDRSAEVLAEIVREGLGSRAEAAAE
jgi:glycosyltransferase involved in cell wall biosynthesis/tetratricopeptide (TPR) repeat protein